VLHLAVALGVALGAAGCGDSSAPLSPLAERGRQTYLAQCTVYHGTDPAQPGPVGPSVKGSSRELIEAKVLKGAYPPGYTAKRPTGVMLPMPAVAADIGALAEYLR
jgi:mono/diheme cytochrome c family protein